MAKQVKHLNMQGLVEYTDAIGLQIAGLYEAAHLNLSVACDSLRIPTKQVREWLTRYPAFGCMIAEVDKRACDAVKAALYEQAMQNPTSARLFLDLFGSQAEMQQVKAKDKSVGSVDGKQAMNTLKKLLEQSGGDSKPPTAF